MKQESKRRWSRGVLTGLVLLGSVLEAGATEGEGSQPPGVRYEQSLPSLPPVLVFQPESSTEAELSAAWDSGGEGSPGAIEVFYPVRGQSSSGVCWMGLRVDRRGYVYPSFGNISRIRPDGELINGADDSNYFVTGGAGFWFALDERRGILYNPGGAEVLSAPFTPGSTFSPLLSGLESGTGIALGQGVLSGSLLVTEPPASRVSRVRLSPLGLSIFSSDPAFFASPEAVASAPDGSLYVVNLGATPPTLTRIAPDGTPSTFATGTVSQVNRAVAVDLAGNVYWSRADGFVKYSPSGEVLDVLPGPPDQPLFGNPMGADFDKHGNLFVVDNFGCKKVYKYSRVGDMTRQVVMDIEPGDDTNELHLERHAKVKVALLSTESFDATRVAPWTIRFGATGTEARPVRAYRRDVDGDGRLDKVLCFKLRHTGLSCDSTSAVLTGRTRKGQAFRGTDAVRPTGHGCP